MVTSCCGYGCTERHKKGSLISFHKFPVDKDLRKKWVLATKRENFKPTNSSRICGKHFKATDFIDHFGSKRLKKNAVPSIFNFPKHLQQKIVVGRKRRKSTSVETGHHDSADAKFGGDGPYRLQEHNVDILVESNTSNRTLVVHGGKENFEYPLPPPKKRVRRENPIYFGDFKQEDMSNSLKVEQMWRIAKRTIEKQKATIKRLQSKTYRLQKRIKSLSDLLSHLKKTHRISPDLFETLKDCVPISVKQMLLKQMKLDSSRKYSEELRVFALTLNFYSASSYNYVRKTFLKCLPHPKTIQKWYRAIDGTPGYTEEALRAVEIKVRECHKQNKPLVCSLIMDEMAIKAHIQWNGKKQVGLIDYGIPMEDDALPVAKEALVFLLVAVNSKWKLPIAYFLINGLSAIEKANLVKGCLSMIHNIGVIITSLTFDGTKTNLSMAQHLGANFSPSNLKTYFLHPQTEEKIFFILDACHMVKLIRNTIGEWGVLFDGEGKSIKWEYIKRLVGIQDKLGLHVATKVRQRHINYSKEIMKVKLAVQVLSNSVADALDYLNLDLHINEFQGAEATSKFCRIFNDTFDVMNVRNCLSKLAYKRSLSLINLPALKILFQNASSYINGIKDQFGNKILFSKRKTGFLGFLINMSSIEGIINVHIKIKSNLKYLLTYKLSQDHLEMFFSNIRCRGGFTDNPTAIQFEGAYKRLLVHTELSSSEAANCLAQDDTSILKISSSQKLSAEPDLLDVSENLATVSSEFEEYFYFPEESTVYSKYVNDIAEYISGFVVRKIIKSLNCKICAEHLVNGQLMSNLINRKTRGGLITPHPDVILLCKKAEKAFRDHNDPCNHSNIVKLLTYKTLRTVNVSSLFSNLSEHILDQANPLNNHLIQIVNLILKYYLTLRLHHKNKSLVECKDRIRCFYTKLILFKNQ